MVKSLATVKSLQGTCNYEGYRKTPQPVEDGELVLVTGGAGFLGSHLVEYLLQLGYRVRVIDNLSTGDPAYLNGTDKKLEFLFGDVERHQDVKQALRGEVKGVFHLAADGMHGSQCGLLPLLVDRGRQVASNDPGQACLATNVDGTRKLLQTAVQTGTVTKVVYSSSAAIYGSLAWNASHATGLHRSGQKPQPSTPYASSKLMGEMLMEEFSRRSALPTASLRFGTIYGPRQHLEGLYEIPLDRFAGPLALGEALHMENSGGEAQDYIHVADAVRALVLAFQQEDESLTLDIGSGAAGGACLAAREIGFWPEVDFAEAMPVEVKRGQGDVTGAGSHRPVLDVEMVIARGTGEDLFWLEDPRLPLMRHGEPRSHLANDSRVAADRLPCLVQLALEQKPKYAGWGPRAVEKNFSNFAVGLYADKMLAALGVHRREPNVLVFNAIFATTREAIHAHPKEWWVLVWEHLTNGYKFPESHAAGEQWQRTRNPHGGEHLLERYWHVFLDPHDEWEANWDFINQRCPGGVDFGVVP
ncbi:hypothetical protein N2152v2_002751 [Parachlorella kessleri]